MDFAVPFIGNRNRDISKILGLLASHDALGEQSWIAPVWLHSKDKAKMRFLDGPRLSGTADTSWTNKIANY
jgi:hypothetical protein